MIFLDLKTQNILKHAVAAVITAAFLYGSLSSACLQLHQALPGTYPDTGLMVLARMLLHPSARLVCFLPPCLYSLAVHQLTFVGASNLYGTFNAASIEALKVAGRCIGLGVIVGVFTPYAAIWTSQNLLLSLVGFTLTTLSENAKTLSKHAQKLRDSLDEIV